MSMITHKKLILVEGKDEVEFFGDLLSKKWVYIISDTIS